MKIRGGCLVDPGQAAQQDLTGPGIMNLHGTWNHDWYSSSFLS